MLATNYYNILKEIQISSNYIANAVSTPPDTYIEINLNSRELILGEFKDFLSIETDHRAETVWFKVNRFHDGVDLAHKACVIEYINAGDQGRIYPVVLKCIQKDVFYFGWCLGNEATKHPGKIRFSVKFFAVDLEKEAFIYALNTQIAQSKIASGMEQYEDQILEDDFYYKADEMEKVWNKIAELDKKTITWINL